MVQIIEKDVAARTGKSTSELTAAELDNVSKDWEELNFVLRDLKQLEEKENEARDLRAEVSRKNLGERTAERTSTCESRANKLEQGATEDTRPGAAEAIRKQIELLRARCEIQNADDTEAVEDKIEVDAKGLKRKQVARKKGATRVTTPQAPGLAPDHP